MNETKTQTPTPPAPAAGSLHALVLPPAGLKLLSGLAWKIGRDDCAQGFPPIRCLNYMPDMAMRYMEGYEAQKRANPNPIGGGQ
jgi:hypothetical protein